MDYKDILLMWAKTDDCQLSDYHPLIFHAIDTATVAEELLFNRISPAKREFAKGLFESGNENCNLKFLIFLTSLHDIGKASPGFQAKNINRKTELEKVGFKFSEVQIQKKDQRHNFVSEKWVKLRLQSVLGVEIKKETLQGISKAIGGHHGVFSQPLQLATYTEKMIGTDNWEDARQTIANNLRQLIFKDVLPGQIAINKEVKSLVFQYWFTGFITLSDWLASIPEFFPYAIHNKKAEYKAPAEYLLESRKKAAIALEKSGFRKWEHKSELAPFRNIFHGFEPRVQQTEILKAVYQEADKQPCLIIAEAPMGIGKTEMAFYCAEILNQKAEQTGIYIGMPTQATSNQMFLRFRDFLDIRLAGSDTPKLRLLHSASDLFLRNSTALCSADGIANDDPQSQDAIISANDWFKPKKRGLLSDFAVGTIDQLLISTLNTKHNYLRFYGLNNKTVILDEIHAYDVYMSDLLSKFLEWASKLRINIIMLSATLPGFKRNQFVKAFTGAEIGSEQKYPRFTVASNKLILSLPFTPPETKPINLYQFEGADETKLLQFIHTEASKGACIAVICNTVGKAQKFYRHFKENDPAGKVPALLLHSRFTANKRNSLENDVTGFFGNKGKRPEKMVLFATQIIEQSLDIDFDIMVTELAPVDLLIQRLGRLHRFSATKRNETFLYPTAYWFNSDNCDFKASVYDGFILYRSFLTLSGKDKIIIPDDIEPMIEEVYSETVHPALNEKHFEIYEALKQKSAERNFAMRSEANNRMIVSPDKDIVFYTGISLFDDEDPSLNPQVAAQTRLGEPPVRVVCIHKKDKKLFLADEEHSDFEPERQPDNELEKKIMEAVVPISSKGLRDYLLTSGHTNPPHVWKKSSILRYLRLLIFEDKIHRSEKYEIIFDENSGLIISKLKME